MILPRFIRKLLAVFRGSVSPTFIFLSVALGFWFGLTPGWTGFHTVIVLAVLILNIHLGLFLLSVGVGKALCFAAAPVLFHVGSVVQSHLGALLRLLASIPIIGMTDFSKYSVAGALIVGPVVGVIAGLLMTRSVISFRRMLLKLEEGSERFKKWYSNRWVRILDRLLIGKRAKDAKALFAAKTKVVRKVGVVLAVLILGGAFLVATILADVMVKDKVTGAMTRANGAEVNLNKLDLSVFSGAVAAAGLQVTDAENPRNNQLAVEKMAADVSVYDLLLGRLVMENVEVSSVQFDQEREKPGKVLEREKEEPVAFDPCDFEVTAEDLAKLEKYFKDAQKLKEQLQKLRKWLPKGGKDKAPAARKQVPDEYLGYLEAKAPVRPSPRVMAQKAVLDKVQIPSPMFGNSRIALANVSDAPAAAGLPVMVEIKSNDTPAHMELQFDYSQQDEQGGPKISGTFEGLDLSKTQSSLSEEAGLTVESATASGRLLGRLTNQAIDLTINVAIKDLKAKAQGDGILNLGARRSSEILDVLQDLETTIRVVGPVTEPRLAFDVKGLTEQFKQALVKAGKEALMREIDEQLGEKLDGKLGEKLPDGMKDALDKPKDLIKGLGGLLGGEDEKKE